MFFVVFFAFVFVGWLPCPWESYRLEPPGGAEEASESVRWDKHAFGDFFIGFFIGISDDIFWSLWDETSMHFGILDEQIFWSLWDKTSILKFEILNFKFFGVFVPCTKGKTTNVFLYLSKMFAKMFCLWMFGYKTINCLFASILLNVLHKIFYCWPDFLLKYVRRMSIWNTQVIFSLVPSQPRWKDILGWFKFVQPLIENWLWGQLFGQPTCKHLGGGITLLAVRQTQMFWKTLIVRKHTICGNRLMLDTQMKGAIHISIGGGILVHTGVTFVHIGNICAHWWYICAHKYVF